MALNDLATVTPQRNLKAENARIPPPHPVSNGMKAMFRRTISSTSAHWRTDSFFRNPRGLQQQNTGHIAQPAEKTIVLVKTDKKMMTQ